MNLLWLRKVEIAFRWGVSESGFESLWRLNCKLRSAFEVRAYRRKVCTVPFSHFIIFIGIVALT